MIFDHVLFIFIFLPILLLVYRFAPAALKNIILLIASLIFYAWGNQMYVFLLLGSIVINYVGGMFLDDQLKNEKETLGYLLLGLILVNVLVLLMFKYYSGLKCPMGITFFTLLQISYIYQVGCGMIEMETSILHYAVCVSFFPVMLAGPVLEFPTMQAQLYDREDLSLAALGDGLMWFVRGLAKATILGRCAGVLYTGLLGSTSMLGAWFTYGAFAFQLYFALSGYSDMAIGLAKLFGFQIPQNFRYPLLSKSFSDFTKRWYVSLTIFLNQYLSDATGKRRGITLIRSQMLVALAMGLFFSNGVGTILWGLFIGILICLEKLVYGNLLRQIPFAGNIYYLILSIIGWAMFTGNTAAESFAHVRMLFGLGTTGLVDSTFTYYLFSHILLWIVLFIASLPVVHKVWNAVFNGMNPVLNFVNAAVYIGIFMICLAFIVTGTTGIMIPAGVFTL